MEFLKHKIRQLHDHHLVTTGQKSPPTIDKANGSPMFVGSTDHPVSGGQNAVSIPSRIGATIRGTIGNLFSKAGGE